VAAGSIRLSQPHIGSTLDCPVPAAPSRSAGRMARPSRRLTPGPPRLARTSTPAAGLLGYDQDPSWQPVIYVADLLVPVVDQVKTDYGEPLAHQPGVAVVPTSGGWLLLSTGAAEGDPHPYPPVRVNYPPLRPIGPVCPY
jgi:hypothetical protein